MKKLFLLFSLAILCFSCEKTVTYSYERSLNYPVEIPTSTFRSSGAVVSDSQPIKVPGKICLYKGYLYISDPGKGFHIIDNTNPASLQAVGYVELIGNYDLLIRENILYADALRDLVWYDLSDLSHPVLKGRLEDVFKYIYPPADNEYPCNFYAERPDHTVIGWELRTETHTYEATENTWLGGLFFESNKDAGSLTSMAGNGSGSVNGSMSRFSLYKDHLYAVTPYQMAVLDLSQEEPKMLRDDIGLSWNVETIFNYNDHMFLGTPRGMIIYSVEDPVNPEFCSSIQHLYGCDPVVVEDDLAYVTIHSGNACGQTADELLIIDVSDVYTPKQIASYSMHNPKGLGIDNELLFVCDDGLKAYKLSTPQTIMSNQVIHERGMDGYDLIPFNNILMMITDKGLYQYDYSDIEAIKPLSVLSIN